KYSIADIRDFNNVAPDVAFGLEGMPGHQKAAYRGGFGSNFGDNTYKARTYGGADYMISKVGGLWDALLAEGRHFWTFVNSDFHNTPGDFYPGEYAKTYFYVTGAGNQGIVDSMRSGNCFMVHGNLIDGLDFTIKSKGEVATMGARHLQATKGANALVKIRFRSPGVVKVDHVDLIAAGFGAKIDPSSSHYGDDANPSAAVVATFTSRDWEYKDGWCTMTFPVKKLDGNQYFRLRGTNLARGVSGQTDSDGNPLMDEDGNGTNTAEKAWQDLWFYSNPIFVDVK
ncbi:MAG: hypothetical protein M0Z94_00755, partial [Dehalococcoidales bacterium]|nr:hypothetical protein [Dehalococcoidales bacterium]